MRSRLALAGLALCAGAPVSFADVVAVSPDGAFSIHDSVPAAAKIGLPWIRPEVFKPMTVDWPKLMGTLAGAPAESAPRAWKNAIVVSLPMPDGTFARFSVVDSPVMEPGLAAQFPNIKTFLGQGIDDPSATVRFDYTPQGFHAQILSPNGTVYIDPYSRNDTRHYVVYHKRDYRKANDGWECAVTGNGARPPREQGGVDVPSGANLRTFRLACACTGEYATFHGGTVPLAQAAIVTAVNRVTGVYEIDCSVRMVLVANNTSVVYTNSATDPYTNNNGGTMLSQNQTTCDSIIGNANYDIGHVFSTGGGGVAGLGVVGVTGQKARGVTGSGSPIGDAFYIDYVAHEMGHQFSANHCFNGTVCGGNRSATHAYEPGSGSTIMSYAGICGTDDYQAHSDAVFGADGHDAVANFVTSTIPGVGTTVATGNALPAVNAGANFTIPRLTPYTLTGSATDANGNPLSYTWEQRNLGPAAALGTADQGSIPLVRPFPPSTSNTRTIPRISNLINNINDTDEVMPNTNRTLVFRLCVRDNRAGGGGYGDDDMNVTVTNAAGPFAVTAPNTAVSWSAVQTVTWNVLSTNIAPVSCANVAILLSTDGGNTFPTTLLASTPNDGSESVTLPNISSSQARIKVAAVGNIFFDISNTNFTITPGSACPTFTQHPITQIGCDTGAVQFTAAVNGAPTPTLQWKKDDVALSNGGNIFGATSPALVIDPVSASDAGVYTCEASNSCGNLTSNGATLTVDQAPTITQQPQPQSVPLNAPAAFSVTADYAISYQWKKNNVTIAGATLNTYEIASVQASDVGNYSCFVGGNCGFVNSFQASLTIASACYANCDSSTTPPTLNVQDFACFLNKFASSDSYANCDNSTTPPTLNVQDFACFLNLFASGCT